MAQQGKDILDEAYDELEKEVARPIVRALEWLRNPKMRWARISLAVLCFVGASLWFLPVVGIELLPIGIALLAQDVPFLRRPVGRAILWMIHKWRALRERWRASRERRRAARHP